MKKKVLLINDMPGYGKVALSAMFPILSHMGYSVYNLPTALVSNTLDYGKFEILDTTDYMKKTVDVWEQLGFSFECIATGFIVSEAQVRLITDYIGRQREKTAGLYVAVDPIMGDNGVLYNGVDRKVISYMRELIGKADVIIPNFTEAAFLSEYGVGRESLDSDEIQRLLENLRNLTDGSIVVTSIVERGTEQHLVCGYDRKTDTTFSHPFQYIPVRFPGTGDIFSAVLTGHLLKGAPLSDAVKTAMDSVEFLIRANAGNEDKYKGIPVEEYLPLMKAED